MTTPSVMVGKTISYASRLTNRGHGSTWPGHMALKFNPNFIKDILNNSPTKVVLIAGTNGKTTTSKMIATILHADGKKMIQNISGANLKNGIASTLLLSTTRLGKLTTDYAIFEIDENALPLILKDITPDTIILLNLFRDQLDRYGELDTIAAKWRESFTHLTDKTTLILNADDPLISSLGEQTEAHVIYFGLKEKSDTKTLQHASDSIYCPKCHTKLVYKTIYYSHLGDWVCPTGDFKRPEIDLSSFIYPLQGIYNKYNTLAAILFAKKENIPEESIKKYISTVKPAFGRQEKLYKDGKNIQIYLSKNPTSFNESLRTIASSTANEHKNNPTLLLILNDQIPDGQDISWIWDIDFEIYTYHFSSIIVSGDRTYDMALRLQYTQDIRNKEERNNTVSFHNVTIEPNLHQAIKTSLDKTSKDQILYILPTYSAMLEVRKILTGKKIL